MNNMINLIPYLPQQAQVEKRERREKRWRSFADLIEGVVTLCIGAGFILMLLAFFSAIA